MKEQEQVFDETPGLALEVNGGFSIPIEKDFYIFGYSWLLLGRPRNTTGAQLRA